MSTESLKVNRDLLDPDFDGYKLSLDSLPTSQINVGGVDSVKLRDDEYTLQHVRAFGIHNHLTLDPWNPNCVIYVDSTGSVMQMRVEAGSELSLPQEVFTIPKFEDVKKCHRHNVSLYFPSQELCVLSNGAGMLYIMTTADRDTDNGNRWKVAFQQEVCGKEKPFMILHSIVSTVDSCQTLHCLVHYIEEVADAEEQTEAKESNAATSPQVKKSGFQVFLEWFCITKESDSPDFNLTRTRRFRSKTAPTYAAIDETGHFLFVASPSAFELIHDSGKEIVKKEQEKEEENKEPALYTWTQAEDDVTITFILPEEITRQEISFNVTADHLELGIRDKAVLLEGALHRAIDPALCTWTFNNRKLEVSLAKQEDEGPLWTDLVVGNNRGQYVVDEQLAERIHKQLEHLTTSELNAEPVTVGSGGRAPGVNDLEDCDVCPEETTMLMRFDAHNHHITNQVNIGIHQCLFTVQLDPSKLPCLCLRHDVDGLIWQPGQPTEESPQPWQHTATFNALGYVQASKRERKFAACPSNTSYVVLCDCVKHLYIYRQPSPIANDLRNRKSGRVVGTIAKQQLISLDSNDDILGMLATDQRIFVLTTSKLYIVSV